MKLTGSDSFTTSKFKQLFYLSYHLQWVWLISDSLIRDSKAQNPSIIHFPSPSDTFSTNKKQKKSFCLSYTIDMRLKFHIDFKVFISRSLHLWEINASVYRSAPGYFPPTLYQHCHALQNYLDTERIIKFCLFASILAFLSSQEMYLANNITKHLNLASCLILLPKHRCPLPAVMHQDILSFVQLLLRTIFVFVSRLPLSQNTACFHHFFT